MKRIYICLSNIKAANGDFLKQFYIVVAPLSPRQRIMLFSGCNSYLAILNQKQPVGTKAKTPGNNWVFLPIGFDRDQDYGSIHKISKSDLSVSPRFDENKFHKKYF